MRFYLLSKPHKWGFKLNSLVDSCTHHIYIFDIIFEPGKQYKSIIASDPYYSFSYQIVITLVNRLNESGYRIYYDSWYGSIALIKELSLKGFEIITILRANAKDLLNKVKLEKSSKQYTYNNNSNINIQSYNDKKNFI